MEKNNNFCNIKIFHFIIIIILLFGFLFFVKYKNDQNEYLKEKYIKLEYKLKELKEIFQKNEIKLSNKIKEIEECNIKIKNLQNELITKNIELNKKEKYYLEIIQINNKTLYKEIISKKNFKKILLKEINKTYGKKGYININELESTIQGGRPWRKNLNKTNEINVGSSLDPDYILRTMMTTASIMDSQKPETNLRLHFAVVNNFTAENMLKIYSLREKIKENVEFNFYNAKRIEIEMKGSSIKGNGIMAKLLLPELLPNNVERLIIIDNGDALVLRDLKEMYNWNMKNNLYMGVLDPFVGKYGVISKKSLNIYINTGNYLIDVKKVKSQNMFKRFVDSRSGYFKSTIADQDLINDVAYGKIGYIPLKFGALQPFPNDINSDTPPFNTLYKEYKFFDKIKFSGNYPYNLTNINDLHLPIMNPVIAHSYSGKWMNGEGISLYRRISQYYIKYAGIWDEMCKKLPGYCQI